MPTDSLASVRSTEELLAYLATGAAAEYLCFWGHTAADKNRVGKEVFSQWYPAAFEVGGEAYPTAEHFMMAEKAHLFGDETTRQAILGATNPNEAKKLGRRIKPFDEAQWLAARFGIVVRGNAAKFDQHPALREFLLGTNSHVLVEASPVDPIWGIWLAQDNPHATHPAEWRGLNLLGFALMEVRSRLLGQQ